MSKKTVSTKARIGFRANRSRRVIVISLVLILLAAGGVLARWSGNVSSERQHENKQGGQQTTQSLTPGSPSKEYIYAGGRLVATEEPTSSCTYAISPPSASFTATGGTGSVAVTAGPTCAWTAVSNQVWITVTSGASGSANGTVNYSVGANSGSARSGTITVAGQTFSVDQSGASCSYSITPTSASFSSSAGGGSVSVTTTALCSWSAVSNNTWITITSGASGSGNGTVNYSVTANTGAARIGSMTIAGQTFTVNQAAAPGCSYSLSPTSQNFIAAGGTGSVTVTAGSGCPWSASSNASWITVTSGSSGSGNGSVGYSVAANTGVARSGSMTIALQTFTVTQNAASCSYSVSPTGQNFIAGGGTGSFTVTAGSGCPWSASSNATWITVTSGSSGTGNGSVGYSVAANPGSGRSGQIITASQAFTVTQDGASCSYSVFPTSSSYGPSGGPGSTDVTAGSGCQWTATSNNSWITITSGSSGAGNGTVVYSVAANSGAARTGTMTIAGQTFTVTQSVSGAPPAPTSLTATALTSTSIRLNWSFVEDGISIFKIERKTGTGGTYSQVTIVGQGVRTFTNTKLTTHTTYCYRIRAYNGQDGPYSNEACVTTP